MKGTFSPCQSTECGLLWNCSLFLVPVKLLLWCFLSLGALAFTTVIFSTLQQTTTKMRYGYQTATVADELTAMGQIRTVKLQQSNIIPMEKKIILLWTTYFSEKYSNDYYFFQEGNWTFKQYQCEINDCEVTSNKKYLEKADAVLFHARDIKFQHLPQSIRSDQIKIIYSMEPPIYMRLKWLQASQYFNWTMMYRSDADVQVKYGEIWPLQRSETIKKVKINHVLSEKKKDAIWMVSNCHTQSRRESYVKELQKHYQVDIFGKCGQNKCMPSQSEKCYEQLLKQYKFYLSFENSLCKGYVTEKFFNILLYDIVPVVLGDADYSKVAPPGSYIDATEFPNPKDLALYLQNVADDIDLYNSFFHWKSMFSVHLHPWMCNLCRRLHEPSEHHLRVQDLWSWWMVESNCRRWTKKHGFQTIFNRKRKVPFEH